MKTSSAFRTLRQLCRYLPYQQRISRSLTSEAVTGVPSSIVLHCNSPFYTVCQHGPAILFSSRCPSPLRPGNVECVAIGRNRSVTFEACTCSTCHEARTFWSPKCVLGATHVSLAAFLLFLIAVVGCLTSGVRSNESDRPRTARTVRTPGRTRILRRKCTGALVLPRKGQQVRRKDEQCCPEIGEGGKGTSDGQAWPSCGSVTRSDRCIPQRE